MEPRKDAQRVLVVYLVSAGLLSLGAVVVKVLS